VTMPLPHQSTPTARTPESIQLETALFEVKRVIVGQDRAIERLFVCLLAQGHCLLEGVPGLAKTLAMETLAKVSGGSFARIQFTPDLLPADIVGTRIYRTSSERFDVELGPVFANFVLADEVNRAPAKVQSALLEVMAEHHVSIGGRTFDVPEPFLVLATQNPVEQEGVYPLPEAQRDRFLMKVTVGYPSPAEEVEIVNRMGVEPPVPRQVLDAATVRSLQEAAKRVYVDRGVVDYAVNLVLATRRPDQYGLPELSDLLDYGASPRASLGLVAAGRALALLRGRQYALPQDVFDVAPEILRHRLVLSYEAIAQGLQVDQITARLLSTIPAPRITPSQDQPHVSPAYRPVRTEEPVTSWAPPVPGDLRERVAAAVPAVPAPAPEPAPASTTPAATTPASYVPVSTRPATGLGETARYDTPPPNPGAGAAASEPAADTDRYASTPDAARQGATVLPPPPPAPIAEPSSGPHPGGTWATWPDAPAAGADRPPIAAAGPLAGVTPVIPPASVDDTTATYRPVSPSGPAPIIPGVPDDGGGEPGDVGSRTGSGVADAAPDETGHDTGHDGRPSASAG